MFKQTLNTAENLNCKINQKARLNGCFEIPMDGILKKADCAVE